MALINIDLNDLVSTWRTKTNLVSAQLGDLALLNTNDNSSVVAGINEVNTLLGQLTLDSNFVLAVKGFDTENYLDRSVTGIKIGLNTIANNNYQAISITGDKIAPLTITDSNMAESSITQNKLAIGSVTQNKLAIGSVGSDAIINGAVGSTKLTGAVSLIIYNSAGSVVKTIYGAGS